MIAGNFLKALAQLVHLVIQAYILIIIIRSVISWVGTIPPNRLIIVLRRLTDPVFRYVHKKLPFTIIGGIDISPIIIVVALYFLDNFLYNVLMGYAAELLRKPPVGGLYEPFSFLKNKIENFLTCEKIRAIF
jgi:YggT family protein